MWPRFGIKIGNSTLCIASVKVDGKVEVLANKQGDRVSQACLLAEGTQIECGLTAKQKMASKPAQTVCNNFQFFLPASELTQEKINVAMREITCAFDAEKKQFNLKSKISNGSDQEIITNISPYTVCVHFFKAELELARQAVASDCDIAPLVVISIPNYYPKDSWQNLTSAAEEAGFHVAQVIAEPTAAILSYGVGEGINDFVNKTVLCIKSGGIFSHFTFYDVTNGLYSVIQEVGPFRIGGKEYTEILADFIAEEFYKKYKLDPRESRRSLSKIRNSATSCKHILSTLQATQIYIDSLIEGIDFNLQMSRARFESIIQPIINNFLITLNETVEQFFQNNSNIKCINEIVFLGGTMQIPKLQKAIQNRFPDAKINSSLAADEVVAVGCARQATFLTNPDGRDILQKETVICSSSDLIIWHGDDEANAKVVIKRGTVLPSVVTVNVPISNKSHPVELFHIRIENSVSEICMEGASLPESGVFKIQADISVDEENGTVPVIALRCL